MADLLATKSIDGLLTEAQHDGMDSLKRTLGPVNLVSLGVGAIIGAGIFVLTGTAAAQYAGPAIVLSFVLAGIGCVFAGLCYAGFASLIPIAGSAYTYGYATLGEGIAWIIGWDLILEYAFGAATVAAGWSGNIISLLQDFGVPLVPSLVASPGTRLVLWHVMGALLTGVVHYSRLAVAAPIAVAIDATGVAWGSLVVKVGTFAGLTTTMLVMLLGPSRILFTMSRDGLLPAWCGRVHPRFRTPWISSILVGLLVAVVAALVPIAVLSQLTSIGTLFAFVIVSAGVWVLRVRRPELRRPFKTPLVPLVPILSIAISLLLMLSLPWETWMRLVVWLLVGIAIYSLYGVRHSHVQRARISSRMQARSA